MNKKSLKKIKRKEVHIYKYDDIETVIKKLDILRIQIPGNDSVKFIHKNR